MSTVAVPNTLSRRMFSLAEVAPKLDDSRILVDAVFADGVNPKYMYWFMELLLAPKIFSVYARYGETRVRIVHEAYDMGAKIIELPPSNMQQYIVEVLEDQVGDLRLLRHKADAAGKKFYEIPETETAKSLMQSMLRYLADA